MKCLCKASVLLVFLCFMPFFSKNVLSSNIESNGDGGYCINKIPKRAVSAKCSTEALCEDLLGVANQPGDNNLRCGDQGECVTKELPRNEQCKAACEGSPCGKFCLQEHETKGSMYCIETRDHPNAMPITNNSSSSTPPNKYYCTCVIPQNAYRHRVVSRYLRYSIFK